MKHHIAHKATERYEGGYGEPVKPFPIAMPKERPKGGRKSGDDDPAPKSKYGQRPHPLCGFCPNPKHDPGPAYKLNEVEYRRKI